MKWYNSIFAKVTFLFTFALIGLGAFSFYFIQIQDANEALESQRKYNQFILTVNQIIRYGGNIELIEKYLQELNFKAIRNLKMQNEILADMGQDLNGISAKMLRHNDVIYMLIQTPEKITLYRDSFKDSFKSSYVLAFIAFFVVIILYVLIIKSLMPLKYLRKEIRNFAIGKAKVSRVFSQDDEIGELSKEFNNAIQKIDSLNHSRHLFLRTIMHELKTPITKGRIVAEMVENATQKERLISIFIRLNSLIDSFAKIEEMSSRNYQIRQKEYSFQEILQHVFKQLLMDPSQDHFPIHYPHTDVIVRADFEMLCLAIKNLLDNGLKYSINNEVAICFEGDVIVIQNIGKPLIYPIEEYFKPFFRDTKNPHSQGLGLGLYIIKNTIEAQGLKLVYYYESETHYFKIQGAIVSNKKHLARSKKHV